MIYPAWQAVPAPLAGSNVALRAKLLHTAGAPIHAKVTEELARKRKLVADAPNQSGAFAAAQMRQFHSETQQPRIHKLAEVSDAVQDVVRSGKVNTRTATEFDALYADPARATALFGAFGSVHQSQLVDVARVAANKGDRALGAVARRTALATNDEKLIASVSEMLNVLYEPTDDAVRALISLAFDIRNALLIMHDEIMNLTGEGPSPRRLLDLDNEKNHAVGSLFDGLTAA